MRFRNDYIARKVPCTRLARLININITMMGDVTSASEVENPDGSHRRL